jgi:hypothetical protein
MLILFFILSLLGSTLTFFSGFGLGTILLPLFLILFPVEIAIPASAIVHFANSLFKFGFVYKHVHLSVLLKFGIPAVIASYFGSKLLVLFSNNQVLFKHHFFGASNGLYEVSTINFIIGILIICFTIIELNKKVAKFALKPKYLAIGGILSGFFGGVSGHQGALRSLFLKKANLTKEQLVGTSNSISLGVDIVRISVYSKLILDSKLLENESISYVYISIIGAFLGVYLGSKLLQKITIDFLQKIISLALFIFGLVMSIGII